MLDGHQMEPIYEEILIPQRSDTVINPNRHSLAESVVYTFQRDPNVRNTSDYENAVYANRQEVANGEPLYAKINKIDKERIEVKRS